MEIGTTLHWAPWTGKHNEILVSVVVEGLQEVQLQEKSNRIQ